MSYIKKLFFASPIIAIFLLNFWTWKIFSSNFIIYLLTFIASLLLYMMIIKEKSSKLVKPALAGTFLLLLFLDIPNNINYSIYDRSSLETITINTERSYYPSFIASFFANKINYTFLKYQENVFTLLDPNYYFFASHPRERGDYVNFEKFPFIFILLFFFGLTQIF
jgi:hypothetical protein